MSLVPLAPPPPAPRQNQPLPAKTRQVRRSAAGVPVRRIPSELWSVGNNLNIANMTREELTSAADENGVFRGSRVANAYCRDSLPERY
jgi:hypothetical protein